MFNRILVKQHPTHKQYPNGIKYYEKNFIQNILGCA